MSEKGTEDERADVASETDPTQAPLADRMRPRSLGEFVGQEHLTDKDGLLRRIIESGKVPSLIFWGPPGSGKTTLAYILGTLPAYEFVRMSAVTSGVKEVREVIEYADRSRRMFNRPTILFIDEIHRFNKAQQDAFLPHVERGTIVLLGATTENPSFEVISPLLSRCKVLVLNRLSDENVAEISRAALADNERGLGDAAITMDDDALKYLARAADGDARFALNAIELAADLLARQEAKKPGKGKRRPKRVIDLDFLQQVLTRRELLYDKTGEEHYNLISALHKSIRGSDPDAALYYLNRMLEGGEDPKYIARRLVRAASEDIGLADPFALVLATETFRTVELIGMPECDCALAELVIYLAAAPKSNSAFIAQNAAKRAVAEYGAEPVPLNIRNPVTSLMKELGYGEGYQLPHSKGARDEGSGVSDEATVGKEASSRRSPKGEGGKPEREDILGGFIAENYLPEKLAGKRFYFPKSEGAEKKVKDLLERRWGEGMKRKGEE